MSKGYTKQEVKAWKDWSDSKTGLPEATPEQRETLHQKAIGKHKETKVEYEVYLRHGDEEGEFYVDVRKDIVDSDGDVVNGGEYIEGEIFDDYNKAGERFLQFVKQYEETGDQVNIYNEVEA